MRGAAKHIDPIVQYIHRDLTHRLRSIGKENDFMLLRNHTDLFHRHDHAGLIVGVHHGDQNGVRTNRGFKYRRINATSSINRQHGNFRANAFQIVTGIQHRFVFNRCGDDVLPLAAVHFVCAAYGQVHRLRCTGCKNDL